MADRWGNNGNRERLYFWGLQNHCRWWLQPWNEKMLAAWKKSYDKTRQHIKIHIVKAMIFLIIMYGCKSWTIKKAGDWRIDVERVVVRVGVQSLSRVQLFATPGTAAHQSSLSFTISWSLLRIMSVESVMPSNHLILCRPLLLLPSIFPSISVFSNESAPRIRWWKYWSSHFSKRSSNEY